jgi:hypothetical protein
VPASESRPSTLPTITVRLYGAAIASAKIGTGFFFLINTWLTIELTGHTSSAAISLIMTVLPSVLLAPVLGVIVDRSQPAVLATQADVLRWLVLMLYAILYGLGRANGAIAYAVSFVIALGNELQVLSWRAALGRAVPSEQLLRLNALTVVGGQAGQILGAAASGFVLAAFGPVPTVAIASSTYLLSAGFGRLVARRLSLLYPSERVPVESRGRRGFLQDLRGGLSHIAERPKVIFFYGLILANLTVIFGINGLLAPFVRTELRLGADAFGKIDACYALGAVASGFFIVRLTEGLGHRAVLVGGLLLASASLLVFAGSHSLATACLAYLGLGISFQTSALSLSLAQRATAPAFQGRVNASFSTLNGLAGLGVYGMVALAAGHIRLSYLLQSAGMMLLVPIVLLAKSTGNAPAVFCRPLTRTLLTQTKQCPMNPQPQTQL